MRKISMKKRGRSSLKVENNGNASMEESDEVVNGSEKGSPEKKKRGRVSKAQEEENGKNEPEVSDAEESEADEESEQEEPDKKKKKNSKKVSFGKKNAKNNTPPEEEENDEDEEEEDDEEVFEVEAILDEKKVRNTRHYLVRWKGFSSEHDTWEPERTLNCTELLQKYKESTKKIRPKKGEAVDENADYEVDRIVEVHFKRDGKREFLVSWKGYAQSENTWEPEENMDCADLIAKFMSKVEQAKKIDQRLLRPYRAHTERFTLTTNDSGRRVSKRNSNKQRVRYMDCE